MKSFSLVAVVGCLFAIQTNAASISVADFNSPTGGGGFSSIGTGGTFGSGNGWTVTSGSVDVIGTGFWQSPDGNQNVDLDGSSVGAIATAITIPYGGDVTIGFWLAGNPAGAPTIKHLEVDLGAASQTFTFDTTGKSWPASQNNMGWLYESAVFSNQSAGATTLTFASLDSSYGGTFYGPVVGTVTASIPDGGMTAVLLGVGIVGLGCARRKLTA